MRRTARLHRGNRVRAPVCMSRHLTALHKHCAAVPSKVRKTYWLYFCDTAIQNLHSHKKNVAHHKNRCALYEHEFTLRRVNNDGLNDWILVLYDECEYA